MARQRRRSHRARSILKGLGGLVLGVFVASVTATWLLRWMAPPTTSFMIQSRVAAWWGHDTAYRFRYRWTAWHDIAPSVGVAVVAAEDQKFATHAGFDVESITDAWQARQTGRRVRGASTISQQVAKNLFLWSGRSFIRKGLEAYFTVLIELFWSKRRILEVYVNIAEFGHGIYGVGAASEAFFGRPPAALDPGEAALLAAVLPNPARLHVERPSAYVQQRQGWILSQMHQLGGAGYLKAL